MKKERAIFYKFAIGFALMVSTLWSCKDNFSDAGLALLPVGDLIKVSQVPVSTIKAHTELDGNQQTDKPAYNLLGTFNDSIFGKTTADYACQLRLNNFPGYYNSGATVDSLVYYAAYKIIYGDTITPQRFKVYELGSDLVFDNKYYQDVDLKSLAKPEVLADIQYIPKFKLDSLTTASPSKKDPKDTVSQEINFKLSNSLAQKLMAMDTATLSDNDLFLEQFKGLYVEAEDLAAKGTIVKSTGSGMILYYHKDNDTTKYTQTFYVTSTSARVSHFTHDYSKTVFAADLENPENPDSLLYLQTTGGLRTKILIPELNNWIDSTNIALYGAELIFQIDTTVTDIHKYLPPTQLVFSAIGLDTNGNEIKYLTSDYTFSQAYYGGKYNSVDKTYRFNMVKQLQDIIKKTKGKENLGFYLATSQPSSTFSRVVLKGPGSKTGIRLNITYSKAK